MTQKYRPVPTSPLVKGLAAETDYATQPKGTFPRGSNFLLNKRGALDVCDGSQLVHAFNGAIQSNRGKCMQNFLFSPTGVSSYYLSLMKALDVPLGPPQNLSVSTAAGGTLAAATYFYKVTALDGVGGETTASNEVSQVTALNGKNTLNWNAVPNATKYNVYRGTSSGTETLLLGTSLPVSQVPFGTATVSFVDDGSASTGSAIISVVDGEITFISSVGSLKTYSATFDVSSTAGLTPGISMPYTPGSNALFGVTWKITGIVSGTQFTASHGPSAAIPGLNVGSTTSGGTFLTIIPPPVSDTTQQTALYRMPTIVGQPAMLPVSYSNANIVALFPADVGFIDIGPDGGGGGGSGGGGGTGGGGTSGGGGGGGGSHSTPSGGVPGNVTLIPDMKQFTNRVIIALGNGFPGQIYSDASGTPVNPATIAAISAISVDAFGVVTVTTSVPHGLVAAQVGGNVLLAGVANPLYNGAFSTIQILSSTQFTVRNLVAIGQAPSSGGTSTTTSVPIISTFTPAFPAWSATTAYSTNSIVQPNPANGHYYKAQQGGTSGAAQPAFPTGTGQQVADGSVIWQEAGLTNTAAPPPPGFGHIAIYAGSLWALNTSPTNTATGLDGPCALAMSDVNNPNSWNPINRAFLDKDDGTEGTGLASFTITAQGIPPEGSLVAMKNFAGYQIIGVFGSPTFTIQRIKSDMGCNAPRTLQFIPGFGIGRFTHLGFAVFDGVDDRVISEDIRPFLFPTNDFQEQDITVLDSNWQAVMWSFQTANPPMYCTAAPIGQSNGQLTRIFCYDLVLKAWTAPVDLPFPIGTAGQFRTISANPVSILGGFSDGCVSRWQAADQLWDVGGSGARTPSQVSWSVRLPEAVSQIADQKLNCRRLAIRGINTSAPTTIFVSPIVNGVSKSTQSYRIPAQGDFEVFASFMYDGLRFSAIITGSGQLELDRFSFHASDKPVGAAAVIS